MVTITGRRAWFLKSHVFGKFDSRHGRASCGVDVAELEIGPSQVLTSFVHCFTLGVFKIGL
jgi:hypothetical protein